VTDNHAAQSVLGLLTPDERLAFSQRMHGDPSVRAEVTFWQEHFARLGLSLQPMAPDDAVFGRIEERLFGKPDRFSMAQSIRLAIGAGLFALCGWMLWQSVMPAVYGRSNDLRGVLTSSDGAVSLNVAYDPDSSTLFTQRVSGGPRSGESWHVWLAGGDDPPVGLGPLPFTQQARIVVPLEDAARARSAIILISAEGLADVVTAPGRVVASGAWVD